MPTDAPGADRTVDRSIARRVERWFREHARDLPWRPRPLGQPRDRYRALVSELMLQQTQVSRVLERFPEFIERFPSVRDLAESSEDDVLAAWSGLGYYRRARLLHAAARDITDRFGGVVPESVDDLLSIPGIGRYTAGAIASIAAGHPAPIVDGNVARVLLRVENQPLEHGSPDAMRTAWSRAGELVAASEEPGVFNEGLMELGATVCMPRSPGCMFCPIQAHCGAFAAGTQEDIPRPKKRAAKQEIFACSVVVRNGQGRTLVEQRGDDGLWAGLWQAPTLEHRRGFPSPARVRESLGLARVRRIDEFDHETTHRTVRFRVYAGTVDDRTPARGEWKTPAEIRSLAISSAQRRILLGP